MRMPKSPSVKTLIRNNKRALNKIARLSCEVTELEDHLREMAPAQEAALALGRVFGMIAFDQIEALGIVANYVREHGGDLRRTTITINGDKGVKIDVLRQVQAKVTPLS